MVDQEEKDKMTNNDLQKHDRETKDRATRTPLNTGVKTDQNSEIHHILMQYFCKMMTFKSY
jgi:hypothetical protein